MNFRYLPHTADAKIQAWGKTLEEAFSNAALGMFNLLIDPEEVKPAVEKQVRVAAKRKESLLYDFLGELLFFLDADKFILHSIEDMHIHKVKNGFLLSCVAKGDVHTHYEVRGNIKSITYSEMVIEEGKDKVLVQFVPDL